MAYCPKCGRKVKYKRESDGLKHCRRHGPIEKKSESFTGNTQIAVLTQGEQQWNSSST